MPIPLLRRPVALTLVAGLLAAPACERGVSSPAIGFTYNWGDSTLDRFVQRTVDRETPPGAVRIRILAADSGGWQAHGATALAAEVQRATLLAEHPDVVATVWPGGSREALLTAPVYAAARVPHLVPTATSKLVATAGAYTLLLAPNDSIQGAFIGAFADSVLGVRALAILYVPDEYGVGLAAGTAAAAVARGLTLVDRSPIRLNQDCLSAETRAHYDDIAAQLALRGRPDAVVLAARTVEAGCLMRALRARWPSVHLLVGDGTYLEAALLTRAGGGAEGAHLVAFWHPDLPNDRSRAFDRRWREEVGRTARHGEAVYLDAALLMATAIRAAGPSRGAVWAYLQSLGRSRPPYEGITGPIAFTPEHPRALLMTRVEGRSSTMVQRQ